MQGDNIWTAGSYWELLRRASTTPTRPATAGRATAPGTVRVVLSDHAWRTDTAPTRNRRHLMSSAQRFEVVGVTPQRSGVGCGIVGFWAR